MTQAVQSMTNRTLSGLFWMSLATGANVVSLLLVLVVLARLLTPADFGLAAVALMVIGFSAIFSEFGIGPAVVQRPELRSTHLRSGFTLSFLLGMLLGAVIWLAAPLIAGFFQLDELTPILRTLAWIFPVQSLAVVSESLLQRELRFRALAILEVVTAVLGYGVVGICLATLGFGAWALVGAHLAQTVLKTALLLCVRPHAAWPLLDRRACKELLYFGGGFTAGRFSNYAAGQGEHVVIGYCLGAVALGVYGRAYQLMAGPAVLFGNVLDRVLFPAMVHVQNQPGRLADAYRRGTALIALVILPASAVLVALAPEVVEVLLGPEWHAVTLPLQILGIGMLFRTGCKISDSLVRATGAVYRRTWRQTAYAILVVAGAWIGQVWGLEGVAIAILLTLAINFFLMAHLALRLAAMSWRTFVTAHLPGLALAVLIGTPVAATAVMLRVGSLSPVVVVLLSTAACLPAVAIAACLPGIFLGDDGIWMARKLWTFFAMKQSEPHEARQNNDLNSYPTPAVSSEGSAATATRDSLLVLLTRALASAQVRYCRWKAHVDLQRVLSGEGDLDLLVDRHDAEAFQRVAERLGLKRVLSCFETNLTHEMHLYGLDGQSGVLLHVHVHSGLFGPESLLAHLTPSLEEMVLRQGAPETELGLLERMPVVQPCAELIVFVLRVMEQYARLGGCARLTAHGGSLEAKLDALLNADASNGWRELLDLWLPAISQPLFAECIAVLRQPTSWVSRFRQGRRLRRQLRNAGLTAVRGHESRTAGVFKVAWWRLGGGRGNPKQLPSGGALIAFVGPDASGKSTMVAETTQWLGKVFRVQAAHLGKPPSAWLTLLPNLVLRLLRVLTPQLRTSRLDAAAEAAGEKSAEQGLLFRLRAVMLAWDRRDLALRLARKAARGWLVVCDRYPSAVVGSPDGARIKGCDEDGAQSGFKAMLARLENRLYRQVPQPDIVVRLKAPLAVAIDRNNERLKAGKESDDYVTRRHNGFFLPHFPDSHTVELDTNHSRAATVLTLRRLLWELLEAPAGHVAQCRQDIPHGSVGIERRALRSSNDTNTPVVEFIGVTGVGKSTLITAVAESLSRQGVRVRKAEDLILARYGLAFARHTKLRSALIHLLAVPPFLHYLCTRQGRRLSRLAVGSIARSMTGIWTGAGLLRNFSKRIGCHMLLEKVRREPHDCELILCDEGVVHAAHNLFVHTATEPNVEAIVLFGLMVPKPDLLVWVTAPTSQSAAVILKRGHSRVHGTGAAALAFAEHAHATFELLSSLEELRERIHRVDNSAQGGEPCDAAIRTRASALGEFLRQHLRIQEPAVPALREETTANGLVEDGEAVPPTVSAKRPEQVPNTLPPEREISFPRIPQGRTP